MLAISPCKVQSDLPRYTSVGCSWQRTEQKLPNGLGGRRLAHTDVSPRLVVHFPPLFLPCFPAEQIFQSANCERKKSQRKHPPCLPTPHISGGPAFLPRVKGVICDACKLRGSQKRKILNASVVLLFYSIVRLTLFSPHLQYRRPSIIYPLGDKESFGPTVPKGQQTEQLVFAEWTIWPLLSPPPNDHRTLDFVGGQKTPQPLLNQRLLEKELGRRTVSRPGGDAKG